MGVSVVARCPAGAGGSRSRSSSEEFEGATGRGDHTDIECLPAVGRGLHDAGGPGQRERTCQHGESRLGPARPGPARPGGVLFVGDVCVCLSVCLFVCLLLEALLENNTPAP